MNKKTIITSLISTVSILAVSLGIYLISDPNISSYSGNYSIPILNEKIIQTNVSKTIVKPYSNEKVFIVNGFYDENASFEEQTKSIILYGDTYIKSTGIVYGCEEKFSVVSVLDGEVIAVNQTTNLGVSIEIKHSNDMVSIYQSLTDSIVKVGDKVKQGQIIGNSGTTNITNKTDNQLYFELILSGKVVNPNEYFNKEV